uniref:Protein E6 n=1 Tax=Rousettus bat papillomavirus TaxID=3141903 RepID=A0AAU7E2E0_9PAPI
MDEPIRSVAGLCQHYGIHPADLVLKCLFCRTPLPYTEVADFDQRGFQLAQREGYCFGCCKRCLRISAQLERDSYLQNICTGTEVEVITDQLIYTVTVRCTGCLKRLTAQEKLQLAAKGDLVFERVRGQWRAPCNDCFAAQEADESEDDKE